MAVCDGEVHAVVTRSACKLPKGSSTGWHQQSAASQGPFQPWSAVPLGKPLEMAECHSCTLAPGAVVSEACSGVLLSEGDHALLSAFSGTLLGAL